MVKGELHPAAFLPYIGRMILCPMGGRRIYLREWRKHRHLTQKQVVDRLAFLDDELLPSTEASLSRLENGKQPYSQRILEALADIYEAEPDQLIGWNPEKEGRLIDLVTHLNARQRAQAMAVLEALVREAGNG